MTTILSRTQLGLPARVTNINRITARPLLQRNLGLVLVHYTGVNKSYANADLAKAIQRKTLEAYNKRSPLEVSLAGGGGAVKKTLRRSPQFDTSYFKICDEEDPAMRYGIWNHQEDLLINILRPMTINRAERNITELAAFPDETDRVNPEVLRYVNRLSDMLFVFARAANDGGSLDVLWKPGATR
jgi:hypothetical protein